MNTAIYEGFTQEELKTAFDLVADTRDWKAEIAAMVPGEWVLPVVAAIKFYTATVPEVKLNTATMSYYITSEGYRRGPAGDH